MLAVLFRDERPDSVGVPFARADAGHGALCRTGTYRRLNRNGRPRTQRVSMRHRRVIDSPKRRGCYLHSRMQRTRPRGSDLAVAGVDERARKTTP